VIDVSKILNIASVLLFIVAIFGVVFGLLYLVGDPLQDKVFSVNESEIRAFNSDLMDGFILVHRSEGLYMLCLSLAFCFVSLVPFRNGEKWAWYFTLGIFGIALVGQAVITYVGSNILVSYLFPASILLIILWLVGLIISIKEFNK
jgi:hypothetical protein